VAFNLSLPNGFWNSARLIVGGLILCHASCGLVGSAIAAEFRSSKTQEGVHRKAVITSGDAKLFKDKSGEASIALSLMDVLFLMEGDATGDRKPVSRAPDADRPDGWLDPTSFVEWNAVQMVDFAPQGGRKLVEVQQDAQCAIDFANTGRTACKPLGAEPDRLQGKSDFKMLIPVFAQKSLQSTTVYEGGFVRVTPGAAPKVVANPTTNANMDLSARSGGIELVLALDATASMTNVFRPTADAIADFVAKLKADLGSGEVPEAVRIGLLMYQDRTFDQPCTLDFLTEWKVPLTAGSGIETVEATMEALRTAKVGVCVDDDYPEAVLDAVNRTIVDPRWKDGSFRIVMLIGDAPPHGDGNALKNPDRLSQAVLHREADKLNIRFVSAWINHGINRDSAWFQRLAEERKNELRGRFSEIAGNPATMRRDVAERLWQEWTEIVKPYRELLGRKVSKADAIADPNLVKSAGGTDYSIPIIVNMLPDAPTGPGGQAFSRGWVPQNVMGKTAVDEYVFMSRASLRLLIGAMNAVLGQAEISKTASADEFITALRSTLASQFKVNPDEIFAQGETLAGMLRKKNILPFETGLLRFTADEIRQWRPEDYDRVIKLLGERVTLLEKFTQVATNSRSFGNVPHFFVPQELFP